MLPWTLALAGESPGDGSPPYVMPLHGTQPAVVPERNSLDDESRSHLFHRTMHHDGEIMPLANFMTAHRERILEEWERRASARTTRVVNADQLRDHLDELLDAIARELTSDAAADVQVVAEKHAAHRAHEGMLLQDMVSEFPVLRSCVIQLWMQSLSTATLGDLEDVRRFDEALDRALTESVSEFMNRLNRARETFLGILGHDLRNPLATIITGGRLLLDDPLDAERSRDVVRRLVVTGERMHQLVIDLLDFTRTRFSGEMPIHRKECDLAPTVRHAVDEVATAHPERRVTFDISGDLSGRWDDRRMGQAIGNLLGNAVQHGAGDKAVELSARGDDCEITIAVHNDGPPIPEETRAVLFNPLAAAERRARKRDPDHLGLGLYIAKAIVTGHEGTVDVESSTERGTTFTMRFSRRTVTTDARANRDR